MGCAWFGSLSMPTRPEHIFTCGSPVLSSKFHPTESPLVIGGCQSGQLVIWDIRAGRLRVQRSGQGYPISAIQVLEGGVSIPVPSMLSCHYVCAYTLF
jgi:dynein intermediate chain